MPWAGVDPIVTAAQVVLGLQTVVSRTQDISREPAVRHASARSSGGVRENIIPDEVEMRGTIRSFDEGMRDDIHERVTTLAEAVGPRLARRAAAVCIRKDYPVTVNDPALTEAMLPTLQRVAGAGQARPWCRRSPARRTSPSSSALVPGLFVFLGTAPDGQDPATAAPNHSPRFFVDERCLIIGVRALAHLACDFLERPR